MEWAIPGILFLVVLGVGLFVYRIATGHQRKSASPEPAPPIAGLLHSGSCTCRCRACRKNYHCSNVGSGCRIKHRQNRERRS